MRVRPVVIPALLALAAGCSTDTAKSIQAGQEIGSLTGVLMSKNAIPKDQAEYESLTAVVGAPNDPWGNPYVYERLGTRKIRISSKGPDGKLGTPDDVSKEFEFPSGVGLESLTLKLADGSQALKSPDGKRAFWTVQKDVGADQVTQYFVGDGSGKAKAPVKTAKVVIDDYRRGVTLMKWSNDGRYLVWKDFDSSNRPDAQSRESTVAWDSVASKEIDQSKLDPKLEWTEY